MKNKTNNNLKNINKSLLILCLFYICSSFQQQESQLIIGSWKLEEEHGVKLVFSSNNTVKEFIDNSLFQEYTWTISKETSDNGIEICYLDLVNIEDNDDKYTYEITTLNNQYLGLVYLNGSGLEPAIYIKN